MLAGECGKVQVMQPERDHKHPTVAPESGQLWTRDGVLGGMPRAHASMLLGMEAARMPAAAQGFWGCSPFLPTRLGYSRSSLAQPLAWLGNS